jgi:CheY-like chemotaxis protein
MPRLVILDVNLPGIGGTEVCRRIRRQHGRSATVIFITSNDRLEILHECIEAAATTSTGELLDACAGPQPPARAEGRHSQECPDGHSRGCAAEAGKRAGIGEELADAESPTDEVVAALTHFIKAARAEAPNGFGRAVDEKLYILGYIAGVVNFVANSSMMLKIRFLNYLKATLYCWRP